MAGPYPSGQIVPRVACESDPKQSYALYLPTSYSTARKWPILCLYDPRSRGAFAAERFREAAEKYGWILASSNNTMSDGPLAPNIVAVAAVWADVNRRFPIDPRRVYAAGFSGGARTACLLAQKMDGDVAGVIRCGGGFMDNSPPQKGMRFAFFGAVGNVDFNYGEMRRLDRTLAKLGAKHPRGLRRSALVVPRGRLRGGNRVDGARGDSERGAGTAVKKGFRQVELIETDPDLASLREEKDYRAIVEELKAGSR